MRLLPYLHNFKGGIKEDHFVQGLDMKFLENYISLKSGNGVNGLIWVLFMQSFDIYLVNIVMIAITNNFIVFNKWKIKNCRFILFHFFVVDKFFCYHLDLNADPCFVLWPWWTLLWVLSIDFWRITCLVFSQNPYSFTLDFISIKSWNKQA